MVKRNTNGRKQGGVAGIAVVDDPRETDEVAEEVATSVDHEEEIVTPKKERKSKAETQADGSFGVGDVRKAAAFVNSVGGLDKAIALLQILKVAKEVQ